jgi:hypothetical protein
MSQLPWSLQMILDEHHTNKRKRNGPIAFLNDPHKKRSSALKISHDEYKPLGKTEYLQTSLIDYLLQCSLPSELPSDVLVGSSASLHYLNNFVNKLDSKKHADVKSVETIKKQYQYYAMRRFHYIGINCAREHFLSFMSFLMEEIMRFSSRFIFMTHSGELVEE